MDNNSTLGDRLQYLRKKMIMSQKDFEDFLSIPQPSLSAYENNRNWLCGISSVQFYFIT